VPKSIDVPWLSRSFFIGRAWSKAALSEIDILKSSPCRTPRHGDSPILAQNGKRASGAFHILLVEVSLANTTWLQRKRPKKTFFAPEHSYPSSYKQL
jgi:hypothetical protein